MSMVSKWLKPLNIIFFSNIQNIYTIFFQTSHFCLKLCQEIYFRKNPTRFSLISTWNHATIGCWKLKKFKNQFTITNSYSSMVSNTLALYDEMHYRIHISNARRFHFDFFYSYTKTIQQVTPLGIIKINKGRGNYTCNFF